MSLTGTEIRSIELSEAGPDRRFRGDSASDVNQTSTVTALRNAVGNDSIPENAAEAIPDGGYGWTVVASCFLLLFWINGYTTTWGVLQTAMLKSPDFHANIQTITFVGSLYMACMVAFGLASVRLMSAYGARNVSLVAVALFGLGLIATSFLLNSLAGLFCMAGVLVGLATSLLYTATNTLPTQWFSGKLGTANGLVKTGGGVGATVLPLAAQALIDRLGLQWAFRIIGLSILITGLPCALLIQERARTGTAPRFDWSPLKSIPFQATSMAGAVGVFALFVPPFFLPLFASSIGLSAATGAGLVAGFGASTAIGRLLGGWVCDRIGAVNTLAITALVNGLTMLAIWPVSSTPAPLFIFAIVNGFANGGFFVALPTAVAKLAPGSASASISLMTSFWTPGYLLGTPIAGILIEATGAAGSSSIEPYRAAIFYAAGVGTFSAFLVAIARFRLDTKMMKKL